MTNELPTIIRSPILNFGWPCHYDCDESGLQEA